MIYLLSQESHRYTNPISDSSRGELATLVIRFHHASILCQSLEAYKFAFFTASARFCSIVFSEKHTDSLSG